MLRGKTALVTGSTSGIGQGVAEALAAQGADVVLNGFGESKAIEAQRAGLASKYGVRVRHDDADMSKPDAIAMMIARTNSEFGAIDILVNNAGIQHVAPIEEFPVDKWNAIIAINLVASFHTMRHAIPKMKERRWGRIINVASAHALVASPFKSAYVAAKHGVAGLVKTVALEVAELGLRQTQFARVTSSPRLSKSRFRKPQRRGEFPRKRSCATFCWPRNRPSVSSEFKRSPRSRSFWRARKPPQ
jgi:3-hydroxybutyrate dehydrogenase